MNRLSLNIAFVAVPLMVASIAIPAGLDNPVDPLLVAGLPLLWAAIVATLTGSGARNMAFQVAAAIPFSAYAAASFGTRPALPALVALAACMASAVAVRGALPKGAMKHMPVIASILAGAVPGAVLAVLSGAPGSVAVSILIASIALYLAARRGR